LLRKETIEYLKLHPELLTETAIQNFAADKVDYNLSEASSSLIEMQRIFDDITTHYGMQQTYADNFIVQLIAKILKANIVILREDQDLVVTFPDEASSLTYYLYLKGEHYQSISLASDQITMLEEIAKYCIANRIESTSLQNGIINQILRLDDQELARKEQDLEVVNQILSDEAIARKEQALEVAIANQILEDKELARKLQDLEKAIANQILEDRELAKEEPDLEVVNQILRLIDEELARKEQGLEVAHHKLSDKAYSIKAEGEEEIEAYSIKAAGEEGIEAF